MADVFYSVRPAGAGSGNDLKVACNIVIASGVATFSVAQTGDIGVGCYVLSSNTDGYISEMTDSTHAKIITALGATHANVSSEALTSIYHPYASLSAAEAGSDDVDHLNNSDLTATGADVNLFWPCYGATADATRLRPASYETDSTHLITTYTPQGLTEKESINTWRNKTGIWSDNYFHMESSQYCGNVYILSGETEYLVFDGIQFNNTYSGGGVGAGIYFAGNTTLDLTVKNCIFKKINVATSGYAGAITGYRPLVVHAYNNVIYDFAIGIFCKIIGTDGEILLYNNTIIDSTTYGIRLNVESASGVRFRLKNNIVQGSGTADYNFTGGDTTEYLTNISEDTSSPNSTLREKSLTFAGAASNNFQLASTDTDAINAGTNLSADSYMSFAVDNKGTSRPQGTAWDIGAFEFPVAVAAGAIINQFQKANLGADLFNGSLI